MGRNGVADTTSSSNFGEEYHTPKGGTRCVRVRFELSWSTFNALSSPQGSPLAQKGQGQSGSHGAFHHSVALWQQWLQPRGLSWHRCRHTAYWHLCLHGEEGSL